MTLVTTCDNCGVWRIVVRGQKAEPCRMCGSSRLWRRQIKVEQGKRMRHLEGRDRLVDVRTGEVMSEDPERSPMATRTFGRFLEKMVRLGIYADLEMENGGDESQ